MMKIQSNKFNIFSLRNRYIPAILIVAVFAFFGYLNVKEIMHSIKQDGTIINMSGKQRMLSQKLVVLAQNYFYNQDFKTKDELEDNIKILETAHHFLKQEIPNDKLQKIYIKLNKELFDFTSLIKQLYIVEDDDDELLNVLRQKSQNLLFLFDSAVQEYKRVHDVKLQRLERNQKYIFFSILVILFLEGILIFYPASKRMKQNTQALENAIQDKTKELQKSIDIISNHVIYSRTNLNGIITYASKAFSEVSGFSNKELVGKPHNIVRHKDMPASAFEDMWNTIKAGRLWRGEVKNRKKGGGYYWVDAFITPEYDNRGNLIGYAGVRHNITSKKAIEALNRDLKEKVKEEVEKNRHKDEKLHEQTKMIQMSELLGNIAHHWRQPLSAISTASSGLILKKEVGLLNDEEYLETLKKIMAITKDLSRTIDEFTGFVNIDKKPISFDVQKRIDDTLALIANTLDNHHINVDCEYEDKPLTLFGVPSLLSQAILNILTNAKDVILEKHIKKPVIKLIIKKEQEIVNISIEDNAGGIDEKIIYKIFEPYFTTKHQSQGTGMGLHYTYKLISHDFHGELRVENTSKGAKFIISIPIRNENAKL